MYPRLTVAMCAAFSVMAPMALAAPHFAETRIVAHGNQNVNVTGINDSGVMVGEVYAPITGTPSGFMLSKKIVTKIPAPYNGSGPAQPTSIYNDGTIIGHVDLRKVNPGQGFTDMFVLRNGAFDPSYQIELDAGIPQGQLGVNTLGLVGTDVFFTRVINRTLPNTALYGTPPKFRTVPKLAQFNTIKGLSAAGVVSGTSFQEMGPQKVFLGNGDDFQFIAPSGAISASGGFANAAGEVAGSYKDSSNVPHGFVYNAGAYTSFDMPKAASDVTVTAINDKGWVVGIYTGNTNRQHAFIYDGISVTSIGTYDPTSNLTVAVNNMGQAVIAEQFYNPVPKFVSFLETCHAGSC
jgi:probable HAF family extracellular repeat protein